MNKLEVIKDMMNSENATVLGGIGGIVLLVGIDLVTKRRYRFDGGKEFITIAPAQEKVPQAENKPEAKKASAKKNSE